MRKSVRTLYLFQKPYLAVIQWVIDAVGRLLFLPVRKRKMPTDVRKILVSRIDHLGDVFIASSILPHLKKAFPRASIHFMAGEWARGYLRSNPHIDSLLVYNSMKLNRNKGLLKNALSAVTGFAANVREMRSESYDLCIDLRAYPFNSILLLVLGGGKYRVGFSTGGFGFLLDNVIPYRTGVHEITHVKDALSSIGINVPESELRPEFVPTRSSVKETTRILEGLGIAEGEKFVLVHTGSGAPKKLWRKERWQELVKGIIRRYGIKVVLYDPTYGDSIKGCIKLPPLISFEQFAVVAKKASLFIGLDSLPAHLAASFGTPVVVLWCGINDFRQWKPVGEKVALVRKDVDCAPCFKKNGCAEMHCMDITADECMREAAMFLDPLRPARAQKYMLIS